MQNSPRQKYSKIRLFDRAFIYCFILLNSISGLKIADVPVNGILMIVFFGYISLKYLSDTHNPHLKIQKGDTFVTFIIASMISCLLSVFATYSLPHQNVVAGYLANGLVYFFIYLLLYNTEQSLRNSISVVFKNGLVYAARIQAVWGIAQLVLLYSAGININEILFVDILHSTTVRDWIMGFYTGNTWNLRITGLNFENSMFALVVCVGVALEKKIVWKLFMTAVAILSLSRTGWVMLAGYYTFFLYQNRNKFRLVKKRKLMVGWISLIAVFACFLIAYTRVPTIRMQIDNIIIRATDSDAISISGARHLLYYPYGVDIFLFRSNILQILFGYGMRCSGIAFSQQPDICQIIGIGMYPTAWAVECDVIGLLLGGGIVTFLAYYATLIRTRKSIYSDAILMIFLGGITYHYHSISYVILIILMASLVSKDSTYGGRKNLRTDTHNKENICT